MATGRPYRLVGRSTGTVVTKAPGHRGAAKAAVPTAFGGEPGAGAGEAFTP